MKRLPMNDAILAHSVPSICTESAIVRVGLIKEVAALDVAETMEHSLNGRSVVLQAIARRRTEIRELAAAQARKGGAK